jgi:eukaryotic-like serine/threonine-protein kinase
VIGQLDVVAARSVWIGAHRGVSGKVGGHRGVPYPEDCHNIGASVPFVSTGPSDKDLAAQTTVAVEPTDGGAMSADLAGARPSESPALVLARARVGGALFGAAVGLGRFRVLERLGGGGMGIVYAAYDPELDRGVALKTVHVPRIGREIALAEAKALARLAHPNVVPVFDVGADGEHVYIVMELVRGETLGAWVKDKTQPEILDVYRQSGHALAAAHAAGLVHRDFKPDNAIVGTDGRVRVVDFGLACEAATDDTAAPARVGGTPRYMAPEQAAGAPATPAADQYSFGVSLGEALRGEPGKPVPRWLEAVVERATTRDPAARFESMPQLLRALGRDPARLRRRAIVAAAVATIVVGAFAIGRTGLVPTDEPCSGGERLLAATWNPVARQVALARIAGLSAYGGELAGSLGIELTDHAHRWVAGHRAACLAYRRGEQSPALLDRRMACLDRGRAALHALADLVTTTDARGLPGIARAAQAIPDPDSCSDVRALTSDVEPASPAQAGLIPPIKNDIERARVRLAAGNADDARRGAAQAVAAARGIGYRPVLAEALLVEGHARISPDDRPGSIARMAEATRLALSSGSDAIAIEAWARRAWVEGTSPEPGAALDGFAVIDALASRTQSAFARALLHNNVGSVELGRDHRERARALLELALDDAKSVTGAGAIEMIQIRSNMALVTDDLAKRDGLLRQVHAELSRLLGESHPDTLVAQFILANTAVVPFAEAAKLVTEVCQRRELHSWLAAVTATCWLEAADLRSELGFHTAALVALDSSIRFGSDTNPETLEVNGYRALWRGDTDAATAAFTAALAEVPPRPDEPWYWAYTRARLLLGIGRAFAAQHRLDAAATALERAVDIFEPLARKLQRVAIDRRLGRARAELARVHAAIGAPPARTRELAAAALVWLRAAGAPADELAELERLTEYRAHSPR